MTSRITYTIVANREVRAVPPGWEHPRDEQGEFVPLLPEEMPDVGADSVIVAYETTSEGTPISPAYPNDREGRLALVRYCAEHCTTFASHRAGAEAWAVIFFGGGARIGLDGTVEAG